MPSVGARVQRAVLVLLALLAGGAIPIQLVTLSFGYAQYIKKVMLGPKVIMTAHQFASWYLPWVYLPAMGVLAAIVLYARRRHPDLCRRILVGFGMGAVATVALDAAREAGVIHGWLPGDTPVMFGKMATGSQHFAVVYATGLLIHYLNGADFGLVYAFVWGKRRSYREAVLWATGWALLVELGMMLGPPMGPMVGPLWGPLCLAPAIPAYPGGARGLRGCPGALGADVFTGCRSRVVLALPQGAHPAPQQGSVFTPSAGVICPLRTRSLYEAAYVHSA
ncbi:MAG: hypothetical protein KatS3mg131_2643 [Candidatus Tectimicrobiota bacterium]|nr:MAG: hypothetical protein KatS3mg131_2643 [Candidatus Tectomicrobia bacterium]